jgi:NitT/TauT family transport system substrate-binding protein
MPIIQSRRHFLAGLSAASAAGLIDARGSVADEGPPEVSTVRLIHDPSICVAPWFVGEDLLRSEGFTDVRYVQVQVGARENELLARGELDFSIFFPASLVFRLYEDLPITMKTCRSRRSRVCIPGASSCSRTNRFAPSAT